MGVFFLVFGIPNSKPQSMVIVLILTLPLVHPKSEAPSYWVDFQGQLLLLGIL